MTEQLEIERFEGEGGLVEMAAAAEDVVDVQRELPPAPVLRLRARPQASSVFDVPIRRGEKFRLRPDDPTEYVLDRGPRGTGATLRHAYPKVRGKARLKAVKKQRRAARAKAVA